MGAPSFARGTPAKHRRRLRAKKCHFADSRHGRGKVRKSPHTPNPFCPASSFSDTCGRAPIC